MKTKNKLLTLIVLMLLFVSSCSVEDSHEEIFQPLTLLVEVEDGAYHQTGLDLNRNGVLDESEVTSSVFIPNGIDGTNGFNSLIKVTPGDNGYTLSFGLDTNENGELDADEVTQSIFIANGVDGEDGANGHSSIVKTEIIEGGYIIYIGLDINDNGILEESEITSQITILNGTNGNDGNDGTNGTNGLNSLIRIVILNSDMEHDCENGGIRVYYGSDTDRDGVLDIEEYLGYHDICRCECDCENPVPYYKIEPICCDDYDGNTSERVVNTKVVCEITGFKITSGIVGKPELEIIEIQCNNE